MENQKVLMQGAATLNLMGFTNDPEKFQRLLHPTTIIDAKVSFLTCEGETITVDVLDFIKLNWNVCEEMLEV